MRITRLTAENFKRLKAVDITPGDNTVVIAGRNAQGKTSVLDAIMATLAGRAGSKELVRPIRDGESKARVAVELDDLIVERKWTKSGSTVTVSTKDGGAKLNSPQAVLDKLIGALSFDPLAFAEAEPKKQVETLIDLIGRDEFDALSAERKDIFEQRTDANREIRRLKALVDGAPTTGPERVNVQALSEEYGTAKEKAALRERWERLRAEMDEVEARAAALPASRDIEVVNDLFGRAVEIDEMARGFEQAQGARSQLARWEDVAEKHTAALTKLDDTKAELIAKAKLPVEGLGFDEEGVTFNGVPFVQSSAAERLKVSVAMAMALNPDLRVISIRDASLLDNDSKQALVDLATEHDFQIWYEVVGDGGEVGIVIEDGEVQA